MTAGACVRGASASASHARFHATAASSPSKAATTTIRTGTCWRRRRWTAEAIRTLHRTAGALGFSMETFTTIMTSLHNFPFFSLSIYHQFSTHSQTSGPSQALISRLPKLVCIPIPLSAWFQSLWHHPAFLSRALPRRDQLRDHAPLATIGPTPSSWAAQPLTEASYNREPGDFESVSLLLTPPVAPTQLSGLVFGQKPDCSLYHHFSPILPRPCLWSNGPSAEAPRMLPDS